jgi:hypothetical protein
MMRTIGHYRLLGATAVLIAGLAGHWLITPTGHPNANILQYLAAWSQLLGGVTYAIWANGKARALVSAGHAASSPDEYRLAATLAGLLAGVTGHWLITPVQHPRANGLQYLAAWTQVLGGLAVAIWASRRAQPLEVPRAGSGA